MRIFELQWIKFFDKFMLGSNEDSENFNGESRMRIFILLRSKNSVGKKAYCWRVSENSGGVAILLGRSGVWGCMPIYW